jgi:multicomponent Na+:H+ antiporter subunit E
MSDANDLVVIVGEHGHLRDYVRYALREGRDAAQEHPVTARFVVPVGYGPDALRRPAAAALRDRIDAVVAAESLGRLAVEASLLSLEGDRAGQRVASLVAGLPRTATRVVLQPTFEEFTAGAVAAALADRSPAPTVEVAPVERRLLRPPVAFPPSARRAVATFGVSYAFYLALGDPTDPFDVVTGLLAAGVSTAVLSRVSFERDPTLASVGRVARAALFLPYLLYAVVRANLSMAAVVLHPRLPIDPTTVRIPAPEGRLARALLANSITLTPGTLTVDVDGDELVVHALTRESRAELEAGGLARAVAFVTDGRGAAGRTGGERG